jgi:hypothetical protein
MEILVQLTATGAQTTDFEILSNTDSYTLVLRTYTKSQLEIGETVTGVPIGTTSIMVRATGVCTNSKIIAVTPQTTTTTTTEDPLCVITGDIEFIEYINTCAIVGGVDLVAIEDACEIVGSTEFIFLGDVCEIVGEVEFISILDVCEIVGSTEFISLVI